MFRKPYILFFCICTYFFGYSQEAKKTEVDADLLISRLFRQQQPEDISYQEFYESLFQFYQNPLDLNSANSDELRGLYILNDKQIADIHSHILRNGKLLSVYELQSIESLDVETLRSMLPFITVSTDENTWKGLRSELQNPHQHYFLFRHAKDLEKAKGFEVNEHGGSKYSGDNNQFYFRYRLQRYRKFSVGLTAEKDPGEKLDVNSAKNKIGADFLSFHAMVYDRGKVKKMVLGDYQLQFGQGLFMSGGFFIGKGAETILTVRRNSIGIRPYTSLLETNFLRGCAVSYDLRFIELTPFVSRKYVDAAIQPSDSTSDSDFAALKFTGLHRTTTELAARKTVLETIYGVNANFNSKSKRFQVGSTIFKLEYDKFISPSDRFYAIHDFKGRENINFGSYYSYFIKNISLFGEVGTCSSGGYGIVQGALIALSQKVDLSVVYRNLSKDLHTPYGNVFSENYKNSNEVGIYWGLKIKLNPKTEFTAYYDTYRFPWLKYRVSAPSVGHDFMLCVRHKFNKKTILMAQHRSDSKEKDAFDLENPEEKFLSVCQLKYFMVQLESKLDRRFYLKSRVQLSEYSKMENITQGFMLIQDLGVEGRLIDLSLRASLFDTDDFENRQYSYEKDVLYSFSIPFYSGKGMRNYIVGKINLNKKMAFWVKYGRTTYFDREVVGAGNDQTIGNIRSEIKWQLRVSLL